MKYEYEMYPYIEALFEGLGYKVKAEVGSIDVVGVKSDHIIAVEMKLKFSVKLLYQAIDRQNYVDDVYVATLASKTLLSDLENMRRLARRLHIGLIVLHERESGVHTEIVEIPKFSQFIYNKKKSQKILEEFYGRSINLNAGGISKKPVVTANKEAHLNIAALLIKHEGEMSTKYIRNLTNIANCAKILQSNFYGFFKRTKKAHYTFNKEDETAISEYRKYPELTLFYEEKYKDLLEKQNINEQ